MGERIRLRPAGGLRIRNRFMDYVHSHALFSAEDRVLLAVSGGRDSMMLLSLMHRVGEWDIGVAHCNFQLRGEEANRDEGLVVETCEALGVACYTTRFETEEWARAHGVSIQEACRELRYGWFEELREAKGYSLIATAHHMLDQAETVLMNMFRGAGLEGLKGIPVRNGYVVRPLLGLPRADIEEWVEELDVPYRDDQSNSTDKYTRNFVRHRVIPQAERVNPRAVAHVCESASYAQEGLEVLRHEAALRFGQGELKSGESLRVDFNAEPWRSHEGLGWFWLRELLEGLGFSPTSVTQLRAMVEAGAQTGKRIAQGEWQAALSRGGVEICPCNGLTVAEVYHSVVDAGILRLHYEECPGWRDGFARRGDGVAVLDADGLSFPLILRNWRAGDRFCPLGMAGRSKKLSDFLIDRKVGGQEKREVLVLLSGEEIVWVVGMAVDSRYALRADSRRAIVISRCISSSPASEA